MGIVGKISSFARSAIRRYEPTLREERPSVDADLHLVHKRMGRDRHCPRFFFDAEDNLMDFDTLRLISPSDFD